MATFPPLPDEERITEFTAVATVGPFALSFDLYADDDDYTNWVEVWLGGVQILTGWTLTSATGFDLSILSRPITDGKITFTAAITGDLKIVGARRPRRALQFLNGTAIPANAHNRAYNDLMATLREFWDLRSRMFLAVPGSLGGIVTSLNGATVFASQAEAEAGVDNTKGMTPLRVAQFVAANKVAASVHKNGTNQTGLAHNAYTKISFPTEEYDIGAHYDTATGRLTPPAGPCHFDLQAWFTLHAAATGNPTFVAKVLRNGITDVKSGIGTAVVGFAGTAIAQLSVDTFTNGTDYFEAFAFGTSDTGTNNLQLDGNPSHTFWTYHMI